MNIFRRHDAGIFVRIPLETRGHLYVSPMPFGPYDRFNRLLTLYRRHHVHRVLMLVTDEELAKKGRKDLRELFHRYGIETTRLPFQDLTRPLDEHIAGIMPQVLAHLQKRNLVIHCNAGVGRTGIMAACVVRAVRGCTGEEALAHIRNHMHIRLTDEQVRFVHDWDPSVTAEEKNHETHERDG